MAIAFTHRGRLVIVLDEENVERLTQRDPFDFNGVRVPMPLILTMPLELTIAYATKAEQLVIQKMVDVEQVMAFLSRGYRVTPSDEARGTEYREVPHTPNPKQ